MSLSPSEEARIIGQSGILPSGSATIATVPFAQTFDRRFAISTAFSPVSGQLYMTGIWLPGGAVVTGITFVSGATAEAGGTNLWYALYKSDLTLLAQSTNDTGATSFAATTALRKALTAPQTCPYSGLYYLGFMCSMSAGTTPTLYNLVNANNAGTNGSITGMTPIVSASSTGSLTTTAPNPAGALTAITTSLYAFVD